MLEICCGSYEDALAAYRGGAKQIELNSALALGGLTPTVSTLKLVKKNTDLKVICMVRPRAGGFDYSDADYEVMKQDCQLLLEHGADGVAFGFLNTDKTIDIKRTKEFIHLIHSSQREAVFHRAIDVTENYLESIQTLINLGCNRVLTSGQKEKAQDAIEILKEIHSLYGDKIDIIIGSGINDNNVAQIIVETGLKNIHSSCKDWQMDETTSHHDVSFAIPNTPHQNSYDIVSEAKVRALITSFNTI